MDYLNPNAMLTPLGSDKSWYGPSYDQMLISDVQRRMQAEEGLRHQNLMNAEDRRAKPALTNAAIAKAGLDELRSRTLASPENVQQWGLGEMGEAMGKEAQGQLTKATMPSTRDLTIAKNELGMDEVGLMKKYHTLNNAQNALREVMSMRGAPKELISSNIVRTVRQLVSQTKPDFNWNSPEGMKFESELLKNPESFLQMIDDQRQSIESQVQMIERLRQSEKLASAERIASMNEAGATARSKASQSGDDAYKVYNALSNNAKMYVQAAEKLEAQIPMMEMLKKDTAGLRQRATEYRKAAIQAQNEANRVLNVPEVKIEDQQPAPQNQLTPEQRQELIRKLQGK